MDIKHEFTQEIVCPYCGYMYGDSWEFEDDGGVLECSYCGKEFEYDRYVFVKYSTKKIGGGE